MKRFLALFHFWCQLTANKIDAEGSLYIVLLPQSTPKRIYYVTPRPHHPFMYLSLNCFVYPLYQRRK